MATTILIIEDESSIRQNLAEWLGYEGFETLTAANGREGLSIVKAQHPDLIICDISMPEMNGYDVLTSLQQEPDTAAIPFLFLTAHADKSFIRVGMEMGADDYITKPFTRAEVLSAIQTRLSRHKIIAARVRQEVEDLKLRLSRMVSHELKTPLASVSFVQQVITRQFDELSKEEMGDLLQTLRVGTDRLQHLVQKMVYFTQIETGVLNRDAVTNASRSIYIWQLIPSVIDLARRYAFRNHNGIIHFDQRDMNSSFEGDLKLVNHILVELLTNALNFSPEDQVITISQWVSDHNVWVSILDPGIGMSDDDLSRVAQPFQQIDRENREQQGMGLGLVLVRRIVDLHNGTFQMQSVENKGTQITLGFPVSTN